jgi:hypothetical protein
LPKRAADNPVFRVYIGPAPKHGRASFILGIQEDTPEQSLAVEINNQPCARQSAAGSVILPPGAKISHSYECPLPALRDGYNDVRVRAESPENSATIVWVEIRLDPKEKAGTVSGASTLPARFLQNA